MDEFPSAIIQFVVSDVSKELLPRTNYPRCQYVSFDLSKPPKPQGSDLGSFDVITAFHVLHVVREMTPCLAVLNDLLVPGGSLLIGDLNGDSFRSRAPGSIWFDFVFGSFAEWFSSTDDRTHCTMSPQDWRQRLHTAGFGQVYTAEFAADPLLFTLEAQKADRLTPNASSPEDYVEKIIFHYRQGDEIRLRDKVSGLDSSSSISIWLFSGIGIDGDAGMGFFRSLGREYPLWDIHFVIFDGHWSETGQSEFVHRLSCITDLDPLLRVDEKGVISVPRVVPSAVPSRQSLFQPSLPWTLSGTEFVQNSLLPHRPDFVTVKVLAISRPEANLRTFVGLVTSTVKSTCLIANDLVVGLVASQNVSNFVTVHHGSVALLPAAAKEVAVEIAGAALGMLIGCLGCGLSSLRSSRRHRGGRALVSHSNDVVYPSLTWFLRLLDIEVIDAKFDSPVELVELAENANLGLSGSSDDVENHAFSQALARRCRTFMWNDSHGGLETILKKNPSTVGEGFDFIIELVAGRWPHNNLGISLTDITTPDAGATVTSSASLFDPNKAYLLAGGIGGLGIRVALWMYEVRRMIIIKYFAHQLFRKEHVIWY